jgi:hypothetical protein
MHNQPHYAKRCLSTTITPIVCRTQSLLRVHCRVIHRAERFLSIFEVERCKMIEMSCDLHDKYAANSQFITHLTGRILGQQGLQPTPIDTRGQGMMLGGDGGGVKRGEVVVVHDDAG